MALNNNFLRNSLGRCSSRPTFRQNISGSAKISLLDDFCGAKIGNASPEKLLCHGLFHGAYKPTHCHPRQNYEDNERKNYC